MSEHGDLVQYLTGVEAKLVEQDEKLEKQDARIAELQTMFAELDRSQKTINNQIEIFRGSINEEFRRLKTFLEDKLRKFMESTWRQTMNGSTRSND